MANDQKDTGQNSFLEAYKKRLDNQDGAAEVKADAPAGGSTPQPLRFEDKSEFVPPPPPAPVAAGNGRKTRTLVTVIVLSAIVLAVLAGLTWYLTRGAKMIDLTDWPIADAQVWAADNKVKLTVEEQYNDQHDAGKIYAQDPAKGTTVKSGSFIKVYVSLGHDLSVTLPLPDIMNMTKPEIEAWAAANFMSKIRITTEYSATVPANHVIRYEINDNTVVDDVKRNTPVYIIISKGAAAETTVLVTVPDFKTMTLDQAHQFAEENGLTLTIVEVYDDYIASGTVISQSVAAETQVEQGSEITLKISRGKRIAVPDFSAMSREKAAAEAASLGITVAAKDRYSSISAGGFVSQSISAGAVYESGTIIELDYSLGSTIVLASFVGQTRDAVESWVQGLNSQGAAIVIRTTFTQSNAPKNQIIYQSPANTVVNYQSTVRIAVSLGRKVFVPDFVAPAGSGYDQAVTREKAIQLCQQLNLIPIFVAEAKSGRLPGEIWYQSIAAGSEVYENSTVTLKYVPAKLTLSVPDFTGMTQSSIIAAGYLYKLDITFADAGYYVEGLGGKVFAQSIPAMTIVAYGSKITLTVSAPSP
jgi:eukaryotic-like serine/threonine-protein kinase